MARTVADNAKGMENNKEGGKITTATGNRQNDSQPGKDGGKGMAMDEGSDTRENKRRKPDGGDGKTK